MEQKKKPWEMTPEELAQRNAAAAPPAAVIESETPDGLSYSKDAQGRFIKGPGRKKGSKNRVTAAIEALMEGEAEAISRKCVSLALKGDTTAMKLVLDRIAPVRKGRPIPKLEKHESESSIEALLRAVLEGEISPDEGREVVGLIEGAARVAAAQALTEMRNRQLEVLQKAAQNGDGIPGGVMLVPMLGGLDDWEGAVIKQQHHLKLTVKE